MPKEEKWVVAVSGGPDSMALLHKLMKQGYTCIVSHVNYHMRESSNDEELMVKDYCRENNIECFVKHYQSKDSGNFQHNARNFRYAFFKECVEQNGAIGVAVGHHLDDDIETYVFQKQRKMMSDVVGLKEFTQIKGVKVWRPLLNETKKELVEYCEKESIPYSVDQSNFELTYTRNKIRHSIENRDLILEEMKAKRVEHSLIQEEVDSYLSMMNEHVPLDSYRVIPDSVRVLVLRAWLLAHDVDVYDSSIRFFEELDRQILLNNAYHEFDSVQLYCDHEILSLANPKAFRFTVDSADDSEFFSISGSANQGIMLSDEDFPLTIRSWQNGDKIELSFGSKSVSRYFIDEKIPRYQRKSWLVIENAVNEIIYVVGMGCDVHHFSNNPKTFVVELNLS